MEKTLTSRLLETVCYTPAGAEARVLGSDDYPTIRGLVYFWQTALGIVVLSEISGLPRGKMGVCDRPIYAMHIHDYDEEGEKGGDPTGGESGCRWEVIGAHFDPENCQHPYHAGDLPPLFANDGMAWNLVLTDRFSLEQIIGEAVIIHDKQDDFTSQPSGNSGEKIACGLIEKV